MYKGFTVKLYPNQEQALLLDKHFGCARWVYNEMIKINQKKYHRTGRGLSGYDMQSYLPKLKKQYTWLKEVNASSLQIVCHNLADAYNNFFKKRAGYPKFKRKGQDSFITINGSYFKGNKIRLPKLGQVTFRGGDMPEGKLKRITVKKIAGCYYATALIDDGLETPATQTPKNILGIDLGLKDLIVTSAGKVVKAPKFFNKAQKALKAKQQSLARKTKGSKRRAKAKLEVAKLHQKVSNQRKDFNHKLTKDLVSNSENQAFAIENLSVKNMMGNHKLAKHIADCGWSQFITFLNYKALAVGKPVLEVGRFFPSSKTCSECGVVKQSLPLSVREWRCEDCGALHHRDINAAINIAKEVARNVTRGDGLSPSILLGSIGEAQSLATNISINEEIAELRGSII